MFFQAKTTLMLAALAAFPLHIDTARNVPVHIASARIEPTYRTIRQVAMFDPRVVVSFHISEGASGIVVAG